MSKAYTPNPGPATTKQMVIAVQAYAISMYGRFSWDFVVECLSGEEIKSYIGNARTELGAINKVWADYVRPINNGAKECRA